MKTKKCHLCNEVKPISEFYNDRRGKDGKASRCRTCQFVRAGDPETTKNIEGQRFAYLTAIAPREERAKSRRRLWLFRCECGREVIRSVTQVIGGHLQSCGCRAVCVTKGDSNFNLAYYDYKRGARVRGHDWGLSKDSVRTLFVGNCYYCGALPSIVADNLGGDVLVRNGIDRLDPSIGYILQNCVSCCSRCNYSKGNMSYTEFEQAIKEIYFHMFARLD